LSEVPGSPFVAGSQPYSVTVDPTNRFVYVANWGSHNVSAFKRDDKTGALTEIAGSPYATGWFPYAVVVDPKDNSP
jgi:DNA-binding beta-propeller fold protein YncE